MRVLGRLTVTKVKNAKPADGKTTLSLCDGGGLWLQVGIGKHGQVNRSWYFRYAAPGTKVSRSGREYRRERVVGLGPVHTVGLAEAREAARECRLLLRKGLDPLHEKKNAQAASVGAGRAIMRTFERAAFEYLAKFEDSWKNARHRRQWRETLRDYMLPALGRLDVEAITTDDVLRVLEPIWSEIPETASRVRGRIETVLDFAGRNGENPARWKGHLEHRLAKRNKVRTVQHLPALPYAEMPAFMAELRAVESIQAKALEFCILTACRTGEVIGATWDEIDLDGRVWTIPAGRTKRDKQHSVPLSDAALAVLRFMEAIRQDDRVFPIHLHAMRLALQELRAGVTVHGMRSSFRSWAGACTMTPRDVCEAALGHSVGNAVEMAYMRDSLLAKRRVLMDDWAAYVGNRDVNTAPLESESHTKSKDIGGPHIREAVPA